MNAHARLMVLATLFILSACGGSGSSGSSPESPMPSVAATSTAPPKQPKGEYGVTYEIQNWVEHADDPAVLAWKKISEAGGATINIDKIPDYLQGRVPADNIRIMEQNVKNARGRGFYNQEVAKVKIESATTTGDDAVLVVCSWRPSTDVYQKDGTLYGDVAAEWGKVRTTLKKSEAKGWTITSYADEGTCPGAAPS